MATKTTKTATATAPKTKTAKVVTINDLFILITELMEMGSKVWGTKTSLKISNITTGKGHFQAPSGQYIFFSTYAKGQAALRKAIRDTKDLLEAERLRKASTTIIKNVAGYTATVSSAGIKVGCQTLTLEKFAELEKAVAKVRKVVAEDRAKQAAAAKK